MNDKELKFIKLANYLFKNNWIHFNKLDPGWTDNYKGDEKIFAIVIRTLICNDKNSKHFFDEINGFKGVLNHYTLKTELEEWLQDKLSKYSLGTGKGSHRDNRHKLSTPRTIREYKSFHDLMTKLKTLYCVGPLTAFDISKRLLEAELMNHLPQEFYLTGTGEVNGIKSLYPEIRGKKYLQKMGNQLMHKIIEKTDIPADIAYFGIEDLLCIYQKDRRYKEFLECKISVEHYSSYLLNKKCIIERGIC